MKLVNKYFPPNIQLDKSQSECASILEQQADLLNHKPFLAFLNRPKLQAGIYLYGGVGRGKTLLMRSFYEAIELKKLLIHYQDFMRNSHQMLHKFQQEDPSRIVTKLAKFYAEQAKVICIDEFEIKDITDAMLVGKLFAELHKLGVFVVLTSNTEPNNLYKDGLQRESFLPFIEMICKNFLISHVENHHDYRLDQLTSINKRVLFPKNAQTEQQMDKIIQNLTSNNFTETIIEVFGRQIKFSKCYKTVLVTDFQELCMQDLGYADYVNICQRFTIIILQNVPKINSENTDLAIRFINFIDNAYFHKVLLFISLDDQPDKIYLNGKRSAEFQRTISRLQEMNSDEYLNNSRHNI